MEDAAEIQMDMAFKRLKRYREELAQATDVQRRAALQTLIAEAEKNLEQLRLEVYRPLMRDGGQ